MDEKVQEESGYGEGNPGPAETQMAGEGSKLKLSKEELEIGTALTKILVLETSIGELDYLINKLAERKAKIGARLTSIKEEYKLLQDGQMTMPVDSKETKAN